MENASKALIIAGAILLAILLISLGILIFSQAQDTVNNSGMSQAQINSFNNQFSKYEGDKQKGSIVKSLIQETIAINSDENNSANGVVVTIKYGSTTLVDASTQSSSAIKTNETYKVEITGYSGGRVSAITISDT